MLDLYHHIKFIHILSIATLFSTLPVGIFIRQIAKKNDKAEGNILAGLAPIGIVALVAEIFILLTGGYMSGSNWFNFGGDDIWLAVKQTLFIIGFIVSITLMKKLGNQMGELVRGEASVDELRTHTNKMLRIEHSLFAIVVINIYLAIVRPF